MNIDRSAHPDEAANRRHQLNERLRAEFVAGAEEEWRKRTGRPMTAEELERVLRRHPGMSREGGSKLSDAVSGSAQATRYGLGWASK